VPHRTDAEGCPLVRKCRNDGSAGGLYDYPMTFVRFS
jgi:hypothetical protein